MSRLDSRNASWRGGKVSARARVGSPAMVLRYGVAALLAVAALWLVLATPSPLTIGLVCLMAGFLAATLVLDRESLDRGLTQLPHGVDLERTEVLPTRALIVGAGSVGRALAKSLEDRGNYDVIGFVDDQYELAGEGEWPVLGGRDATAKLIQQHNIEQVFLAYVPTWQQRLVEDLTAHHPEVVVQVVPSPYEALLQVGKVQSVGEVAVVRLTNDPPRSTEVLKRLFDLSSALLLGVLMAVPMLIIAALIRLTSSGPVIFAQERVGRYGNQFTLYKFRTMVQDAEAATGPVLSSGEADGRLTPFGRFLRKTRLDELPQLWNILQGEMSMVGPRPERPVFVEQFEKALPNYGRRHLVRPGMTGLAQVSAGYHTDHRDKLRFDLIYVTQHSPWMDLVILWRTLAVVLNRPRN